MSLTYRQAELLFANARWIEQEANLLIRQARFAQRADKNLIKIDIDSMIRMLEAMKRNLNVS